MGGRHGRNLPRFARVFFYKLIGNASREPVAATIAPCIHYGQPVAATVATILAATVAPCIHGISNDEGSILTAWRRRRKYVTRY
jgi:hypothetical protein